MKFLALYLPGFCKDKLNDKAWGKGFTEWDNVKNGKKLYKGHRQPIVPYRYNYYDLSKKEDIVNQIKIAKRYGVDGFIIYHYWFGEGKQALKKTAEILRDKVKEKFEYCFCWANHTWFTNWHGNPSNIIAKQTYPEDDIIKHIDYLIPFFEDDRYIKVNGRPMLYIYNASDIPNFDNMLKVWNKRLKERGLKKLYIVEFISSKNKKLCSEKTNAVVEFEPLYTTFFDITKLELIKRYLCKKFNKIDFQDYDSLWKKILNRKRVYGDKVIQKGCFVSWDNSARKGYDSMIAKNATPKKFGKYLYRLINNKRKNATNDYIVINSWNEWSEGAMLEPTNENKFKYLEQIKKIKTGK